MFAPEGMDLIANTKYYLTITTRGAPGGYPDNWGVNLYSPSDILWVVFTTFATPAHAYQERGWLEAKIPACPFSESNFFV